MDWISLSIFVFPGIGKGKKEPKPHTRTIQQLLKPPGRRDDFADSGWNDFICPATSSSKDDVLKADNIIKAYALQKGFQVRMHTTVDPRQLTLNSRGCTNASMYDWCFCSV